MKACFTFRFASLVLFVTVPSLYAIDYYVATDGDDGWSGSRAEPNAARTDGPFASPARARDVIRERKAAGKGVAEPVTVFIRGGRYQLAEPLRFIPGDSGSPGAPVAYCAYRGEKPVLSGGRRITGWRRHDDRLWAADVPWARTRQAPFSQLFVNGSRRPRARFPDEGSYFYTRRLILTDASFPMCTGMTYVEGDIGPWIRDEGALVVLFHNWVNSLNHIGKVNEARRRITFARPAGIFFLGPAVRYYVDNVFAGLDSPGEWFLDSSAGRLYYYPFPGEAMSGADVVAPVLPPNLVTLTGEPALGLYVEHLVFRGLSFRHSGVDLSPDYPHGVQGAVHQKGAILARGMRHVVFEQCEFLHLGEHAVSLLDSCSENIVRQCRVADMGGGGIYLSAGAPPRPDPALFTTHNLIDNNLIHDGGHIFRAGTGVFLGGSASYNRITHNEIRDLSWVGVHLGWSWTGLKPAYTHHNEVAYNHIHHLGNGVLNDIGGIYTLGVSPGTVLHHNRIHDITRFERGSQGYGGWGIYLDAGSSEIRVENNVVYNTRDGGFHAHCDNFPYGDVVVNNIFALSDAAQMIRNNVDDPKGSHLVLERNLIYGSTRQMFGGNNWKPEGSFTSNRNCFWSTAGEPDFHGQSFAEWQATGRDTQSLVADPGFLDPGNGDFRLRRDSPAFSIGFRSIDMTSVGLYGSAAWTRLPGTIEHRAYEEARLDVDRNGWVDDFEDYEPGEMPRGAVGEEGGAKVEISDRQPASGERCMRFVDAPGVTPWKPHWFVWRAAGEGRVRMQVALRNDPEEPALIDLEFRDWPRQQPAKGYKTGPYLRFFPDGAVKAAGGAGNDGWISLGRFAPGTWLNVRIEFEEGKGKPKTYTARVWEAGTEMPGARTLPFRHKDFRACTWFGFAGMSEGRAVFYVDDFRLD